MPSLIRITQSFTCILKQAYPTIVGSSGSGPSGLSGLSGIVRIIRIVRSRRIRRRRLIRTIGAYLRCKEEDDRILVLPVQILLRGDTVPLHLGEKEVIVEVHVQHILLPSVMTDDEAVVTARHQAHGVHLGHGHVLPAYGSAGVGSAPNSTFSV